MENIIVRLKELEKYLEDNKINRKQKSANIFNVLSIEGQEIRHSNFLAWLLNPSETHGLHDSFLRGLLLELNVKNAYSLDLSDVVVEREKLHIDILLYSSKLKKFLIIENKTRTKDHDNQLKRYSNDIKSYLPDYDGKFLYLTPSGEEPLEDELSEKWECISYKNIFDILKKIFEENKANLNIRQQIYIDDYLNVLKEHLLMEKDKELMDLCIEIYSKHKDAIDTINRYISDVPAIRSKNFYDALTKNKEELDIELGISTNHFTRFVTNDLDALTRDLGSSEWGKDNSNLILYEISSDSSTNVLRIQVVVGPASKGNELARDNILKSIKEKKKYNGRSLKRNSNNQYAWIEEMIIVHKNEFINMSNDELSNKLVEFIKSNKFKEFNKRLVEDIRSALKNK